MNGRLERWGRQSIGDERLRNGCVSDILDQGAIIGTPNRALVLGKSRYMNHKTEEVRRYCDYVLGLPDFANSTVQRMEYQLAGMGAV